MLKEKSFDTGVVSLTYAEGPPSGSPLVLLHGITGRWQTFLSVIPALAFRYHIYALDFRGHGRSGRMPGAYHWEAFAQDTIGFLRSRVAEPAVLLGHSLGAMAALLVAAKAPDTVSALVLEDPPLFHYRGPQFEQGWFYKLFIALRDLASSGGSVEELASALADLVPEADAAANRAWAKSLSLLDPDVLTMAIDGRATEGYDSDTVLRQITCPVLLLQGDPALGGALEDRDAEYAVSLLSRCTFVHLPGVGHGIHSWQPEAFRRVVVDFLESL